MTNFLTKKKAFLFVAACLLLISFLFFFSYSLFLTKLSFQQIQSLDFQRASQNANRANFFPSLLSKITFQQIPDLEIWRLSLVIISSGSDLHNIGENYLNSFFDQNRKNDNEVESLNNKLNSLSYSVAQLLNYSNHSLLTKNKKFQNAKFKMENLSTAIKLAQQQLIGQHQYMLIFQNSQELRATGGFMGSFALLKINNGMIEKLNFYDIYDADGQFKTQVEAPAGLKEYLSAGKGERLPDANWQADFPSSSQKILSFMQMANFKGIDGVIAVNLETVKNLLDVVGGVYLPDYGMTITSDNFSTIARADRETFFPGKKAKKQFLETVFNYLKLELVSLRLDQQEKLLQTINYQLQTKNIQFFSTNSDIQNNFEELNIAGQLRATNNQLLYLLESNVGINKANRGVSREIKIDINNRIINIEIFFVNNEEDTDYINYQRLIVNPESEIQNIKVNNEDLKSWDEEIITNSKGEKFKQIGYLAPVPTRQTVKVQIKLQTEKHKSLTIYKQPGLPPTPYIITNIANNESQSFVLEKNELISF